jgi:hypothetical protein
MTFVRHIRSKREPVNILVHDVTLNEFVDQYGAPTMCGETATTMDIGANLAHLFMGAIGHRGICQACAVIFCKG